MTKKLQDVQTFTTGESAEALRELFQARTATHSSIGVQRARRLGSSETELVGYLMLHAGEDDAMVVMFTEAQLDRTIGFLEKVRAQLYGGGAS